MSTPAPSPGGSPVRGSVPAEPAGVAGSGRPRPQSAAELAARLAVEREGQPFLLFRDGRDEQRLVTLPESATHVTLGRDNANDIALNWDAEVSRVHAELVRVGAEWVIADQGMSRNGTFLNGIQIRERHRLADGDVLRLGRTLIALTVPAQITEVEATLRSPTVAVADELTPMQRRILTELCRPLIAGADVGAVPASNQEIAASVHLSVQGVKSQLRNLSERFGYGDLPQNRKRLALAERALRLGLGGSSDPSG